MTEFLGCRANLEVAELAPATQFLRDVLEFDVDLDDPELGLVMLHRGAVGLALVRGAAVVVELADHPWGLRDFVILLPGGHRVALGERVAPG